MRIATAASFAPADIRVRELFGWPGNPVRQQMEGRHCRGEWWRGTLGWRA